MGINRYHQKNIALILLLGISLASYGQTIPVFPAKSGVVKTKSKLSKPVLSKSKVVKHDTSVPGPVVIDQSVPGGTGIQDAQYPGGDAAWGQFLQKNLKANVPAENGAGVGVYKVLVQFDVSVSGSVSNIQATTNCGFGMEEEVKRVIALTRWFPGSQNGRAVAMRKVQAVSFSIGE